MTMSFQHSALLAFALAGSASACRDRCDREVPVVPKPIEPQTTPTAPHEPPPQPAPAPAPKAPTAQTPPAPNPTAPPQVTVIVPPTQPPPAPVSPPFAPQVLPSKNETGVLVPAVPLFIDPGAAPGAPGNGAPQATSRP
jgi:hypothetical protein